MALLDFLKNTYNQVVDAGTSAVNAVKDFFTPDASIVKSDWVTATSQNTGDLQQRQTPWRVAQGTQDVTGTNLDPNLANNANNFLDQAKSLFQPREEVVEEAPVVTPPVESLFDWGNQADNLILPAQLPETWVSPLINLAQEIPEEVNQPIIAQFQPGFWETPTPPIEAQPVETESTFWNDIKTDVSEIWDAISGYFEAREKKYDLIDKYKIKRIESSVSWDTTPALSDEKIRQINSNLEYLKQEWYDTMNSLAATPANKRQKILTDEWLDVTPEQFEKFSKEYSEHLTELGQTAVINIETYDKKRFWESGAERIKQDLKEIRRYKQRRECEGSERY